MAGLPEIGTIDDLAFLLRIPSSAIQGYSARSWTVGYKCFTIPKKPTGHRKLHAPVRELKYIQAWILRNVLSHLQSSRWSTAFEPGNKISENASRHVGQTYVVNVDIKDFFPSITANKVFQIFSSVGYSTEISWVLTNLVTFQGKLPQGSPASPKIANLVCHRLDARIAGYCQLKNLAYTRYADDITISTSNRAHIKGTIRFLGYVTGAEGFELRTEKTAVFGRTSAKKITGLVVSDEVRVGRQRYREMRSLIHTALLANDAEKLGYANGYLNFLRDVDVKTYKMLYTYYLRTKEKIGNIATVPPPLTGDIAA
jgi:retron-type reverse transcriptase